MIMNFPARFCRLYIKRYFLRMKFLFILSCILVCFTLIHHSIKKNDLNPLYSLLKLRPKSTTLRTPIHLKPERLKQQLQNKKTNNLAEKQNKEAMKIKLWNQKAEKLNKLIEKSKIFHFERKADASVNYNIHTFYYAWYENEKIDGKWQHWNHEYLKNWKKNDYRVYPTGRHSPPEDIGSNFYPKLGCYSSSDPTVLEEHMKQIQNAGIGVLIASWYPPGMSDSSSRSPDTIFLNILNAAQKYKLKVSPHVEPYKNRNPQNFLKYLKYFRETYGDHPALYKMKNDERDLIVYYIYDSYRTPALEWKELLDVNGNITVRGTSEDAVFLGLLVNFEHRHDMKRARFDGFYTYFATNGFTYGSTWKNWKTLYSFSKREKLIFIPSVGPGYIDTRIRPWNSANTRLRRRGRYYEVAWRTAINSGVKHVSITSFNEWHEGTQIEPAVSKTIPNFVYLDYEPEGPEYYINLTKFWVNEFQNIFHKA